MVLVTDHTKLLESLNRGDRVVVSSYLVHTLVEPIPKLVELVLNYVSLLHKYENLREEPERREVTTLKLVVADAKCYFIKVGLFNGNVLQIRYIVVLF